VIPALKVDTNDLPKNLPIAFSVRFMVWQIRFARDLNLALWLQVTHGFPDFPNPFSTPIRMPGIL